MNQDFFNLSSRDEVIKFEELLHQYEIEQARVCLPHLPLIKAYNYSQTRIDGGKVFASFLDIKINFSMLWLEHQTMLTSRNKFTTKENLKGFSILDSDLEFFARIDFHRAGSSFILRYRALWDKIMGFLVLTFIPQKYKDYENANRRKKAFIKIVNTLIESDPEKHKVFNTFAEEIILNLEGFDNVYRTPEAHGTGVLRKWSLSNLSFQDDPSFDLILGYWNFLNQTMSNIGKIFVD